jgi:hypothetical protein
MINQRCSKEILKIANPDQMESRAPQAYNAAAARQQSADSESFALAGTRASNLTRKAPAGLACEIRIHERAHTVGSFQVSNLSPQNQWLKLILVPQLYRKTAL